MSNDWTARQRSIHETVLWSEPQLLIKPKDSLSAQVLSLYVFSEICIHWNKLHIWRLFLYRSNHLMTIYDILCRNRIIIYYTASMKIIYNRRRRHIYIQIYNHRKQITAHPYSQSFKTIIIRFIMWDLSVLNSIITVIRNCD